MSQDRISKLDDIIRRLYEDNIEGKISDERFIKMSKSYEDEQSALTTRIAELKSTIDSENERSDNTDKFLALVKKHINTEELTAGLIREFVEKIFVYNTERVDGKKVQRIKIIWNSIGAFEVPTTTYNEKSA